MTGTAKPEDQATTSQCSGNAVRGEAYAFSGLAVQQAHQTNAAAGRGSRREIMHMYCLFCQTQKTEQIAQLIMNIHRDATEQSIRKVECISPKIVQR